MQARPAHAWNRPAGALSLAVALAMGSLLGACGQKGPLFLPAQAGTAAKPVEHLPSAPDDSTPKAPLPPLQATSSPGLPSGVVTNH